MEWKKLRDLNTAQLRCILRYFDMTGSEVFLAKESETEKTCFLVWSKCPYETYKIVASDQGDHALYIDRSVKIYE